MIGQFETRVRSGYLRQPQNKQCKHPLSRLLSLGLKKIIASSLWSRLIRHYTLQLHTLDAMLSETLIASLIGSTKVQTSSTLKDAGICLQDLQPTSALRTTFKKSSTPPNGLAVTRSHIFAAQVDKSVIHVYNRQKGNQEATVPFPERIRSLAVAGGHNGEILILGTDGGRLILWEVCIPIFNILTYKTNCTLIDIYWTPSLYHSFSPSTRDLTRR